MYDHIVAEKDGGVLQISLNRPEVLNSFNRKMAAELQDILQKAGKDRTARCLLLTGNGRAFCAGQDLSEVTPKDKSAPELGDIVRDSYNPVVRGLRHLEKPVVCAVNGTAAGAGANIALACDIVVSSREASFIQSFSKVGLIPDSGGTFILPRLIGLGRASALTMLAEKISAEQALEMGLIYKVFEASTVLAEAKKIAHYLAEQPTVGLGLTKRAFNLSFGNTLDKQLDVEMELQRTAGNTNDYREGVLAFLEKRPARFTGH